MNHLHAVAAAAYTVAAQDLFADMGQVLGRLTGATLLAEVGVRGEGEELLSAAGALLDEVTLGVRELRPPPRCEHHHHHLMACTEALGQAFEALQRRALGRADRQDPLPALKAARKAIDRAGRALPGFEPLDLGLSCCAQAFVPTILV